MRLPGLPAGADPGTDGCRMTNRGIVLVATSAALTVAGNLLMRGGITRAGGLTLSVATLLPQLFGLAKQPMFVGGFLFYGLAALIWFSVISSEELSSSYPLMVSITFILVTLGSAVFYQERISALKGLALLLILTGIIIIARK